MVEHIATEEPSAPAHGGAEVLLFETPLEWMKVLEEISMELMVAGYVEIVPADGAVAPLWKEPGFGERLTRKAVLAMPGSPIPIGGLDLGDGDAPVWKLLLAWDKPVLQLNVEMSLRKLLDEHSGRLQTFRTVSERSDESVGCFLKCCLESNFADTEPAEPVNEAGEGFLCEGHCTEWRAQAMWQLARGVKDKVFEFGEEILEDWESGHKTLSRQSAICRRLHLEMMRAELTLRDMQRLYFAAAESEDGSDCEEQEHREDKNKSGDDRVVDGESVSVG